MTCSFRHANRINPYINPALHASDSTARALYRQQLLDYYFNVIRSNNIISAGGWLGAITADWFLVGTVTAITNASPGQLTIDKGSNLQTGDSYTLAGGTGNWAAVNGVRVATKISGTSSQTVFTIPIDTTSFGALTGTITVKSRQGLTETAGDFMQLARSLWLFPEASPTQKTNLKADFDGILGGLQNLGSWVDGTGNNQWRYDFDNLHHGLNSAQPTVATDGATSISREAMKANTINAWGAAYQSWGLSQGQITAQYCITPLDPLGRYVVASARDEVHNWATTDLTFYPDYPDYVWMWLMLQLDTVNGPVFWNKVIGDQFKLCAAAADALCGGRFTPNICKVHTDGTIITNGDDAFSYEAARIGERVMLYYNLTRDPRAWNFINNHCRYMYDQQKANAYTSATIPSTWAANGTGQAAGVLHGVFNMLAQAHILGPYSGEFDSLYSTLVQPNWDSVNKYWVSVGGSYSAGISPFNGEVYSKMLLARLEAPAL